MKTLMNIKKVIIVGCPRSGTNYAAKFFTLNGIDTGHEQFGNDGISSWCLATANNDKLYGPSWEETIQKFMPCPVFHQVRNPVDVISSLMGIKSTSFNFMGKYVDYTETKSKIEICMKIWIEWNQMCERIATDRYHVEKIHHSFPGWKEWPNKKENSRGQKRLSTKQLQKANPRLWNKIQKKAADYGYTLKNI